MATSAEQLPTYHSNESAPYVLPNDAAEQERLNQQHDAIVKMLKGEREDLSSIRWVKESEAGKAEQHSLTTPRLTPYNSSHY